jgi:hypothetical protein
MIFLLNVIAQNPFIFESSIYFSCRSYISADGNKESQRFTAGDGYKRRLLLILQIMLTLILIF